MILPNRLYKKQKPSKSAKCYYIFCEGRKREKEYFSFFRDMDSRIKVQVYELKSDEDNSPRGLWQTALQCIEGSVDREPKYDFRKEDEVWIVFDTDPDKMQSREPQIEKIKKECRMKNNWFVAESNPCFEVWFYYHKNKKYIPFQNETKCSAWKNKINDLFPGGFDCRRHPIYIEEAKTNSKKNFKTNLSRPITGMTEMHSLAESMLSLVLAKIRKIKRKIEVMENSNLRE